MPVIGGLVGIGAAFILGRAASSMLFGVQGPIRSSLLLQRSCLRCSRSVRDSFRRSARRGLTSLGDSTPA
jgi:hypothetical protein